jgi:ComF family protein
MGEALFKKVEWIVHFNIDLMLYYYHNSMNLRWIAEILFPHACLVCSIKSDTACCNACRLGITRASDPPSMWLEDGSVFLGAAAPYEDPAIKKLIHRLKFDFIKSAAEPLGDLLAEYMARCDARRTMSMQDAVVIPIPLSRQRERHRGFNQSTLIAERFSKITGCSVRKDILVRNRNTKAQSETASADERAENIRNCFAVRQAPPQKIILIDDVVTTGATFAEASRALIAAHATKILALAVARA